jgi:hypothetical protein
MPQRFYICIDDTDMPQTRGTNRLAIAIARELAGSWRCRSITKHPHLRHPDIPFTHGNNSCCMIFEPRPGQRLEDLVDLVRDGMNADFIPGSDPGLCAATDAPPAVLDFARRSRSEVLSMEEAYAVAAQHGILLEGLGGTDQGIIGALAGLGSAVAGQPGQFLFLQQRELDFGGRLEPHELAAMGIERFFDAASGAPIAPASLWVPRKLRPSMRDGQPVIFAEPGEKATYQLVRRD